MNEPQVLSYSPDIGSALHIKMLLSAPTLIEVVYSPGEVLEATLIAYNVEGGVVYASDPRVPVIPFL